MTVDAGKTCCTNQCCVPGKAGIKVPLLDVATFRCESQVGHINLIPLLPHTHQAIFWFDISVDEIIGMDIIQTANELVGEHQNGFKREGATTVIEKVFQTGTQQIKHHRVIFTLGRIEVYTWNTSTTRKRSINVSFTLEERGIDGNVFKFDSNLITGVDINRWWAST